MSVQRGTCTLCQSGETYVFESGLCVVHESKRLYARAEATNAPEDWDAYDLVRDYVENTIR